MWPYHREFMIGQILDLCKVSDSFVFVFHFVWFWDGSHLGLFLNHCLYSGVQYLFLLLVLGGRGWVFGDRGLHSFYTQPVSWRGKQKIKVLRCIKSVRMLRWKWMTCKPFNAMSMGIFGNVELTISWRSNSFSSTKWSSLPPPLANLKGMLSPVWKPYKGYKGNQEINKH